MPILTAGTYLVIVKAQEIVNSKVGKPKPSFNYFIQHYEWAHCAWAVDSMEANYLLGNLPKTISRQTNRKHPPPYLGSMNSKMKLLVEKGKSS